MLTDVSALQDSSADIRVSHLPVFESTLYASIENPAAALECRQFTRTIERDWRISSYSALISDRSARPDEPDYDRVYDMTIAPKAVTERNDIFSFPHGAIAGNCIHRIFENLDFNFTSRKRNGSLSETVLQVMALMQNGRRCSGIWASESSPCRLQAAALSLSWRT